MRAFQLITHGNPGQHELRARPDPSPGVGEVVVKVRACGLNRLDLWAEQAALPIPLTLPLTQGCEPAGEVALIGEGVNDWNPGDRVAIQSNLFCGECEFCQAGEESICLNGQLLGVQRDGGFAEKVLVPARALVRLPAAVSFETSAILTLAGSTAMHMLTHRTQVKPGQQVLIMGGASGVGSAAIQIAKGLGAVVIATGSTEAKREFSLRLGADHAVDAGSEDWPAQVRKLTHRRGVDLVVEHVGGRVLERCFECLARGGSIVTCGATAGREVTLNLWPFFVKQQRLIGSYGRNRTDMVATLNWAAEGKIKAAADGVFALSEASSAFAALRERKVLGKVLIIP